jgi:hypothetical protein
MGYDVNITRAEHWSENDGFEIATHEWQEFVASDPSFVLRGAAEAGGVRYENALLAVWN